MEGPTSRWANRTFDGVICPDGRVGTANYWLIIPLVFCETATPKLRDALERTLGYAGTIWRTSRGRWWAARLRARAPAFPAYDASGPSPITAVRRHGSGRDPMLDADARDHPNVAAHRVQPWLRKAQIGLFQEALRERNWFR
ncbi:MAG: hypothetical protein ACLSHC_00305 [Bilophila wadsworthia]